MGTATLEEAATETPSAAEKRGPLKVFRHRALSASVFVNEAKNGGTFHTVALQRVYQDGEEFKHSSNFSRDDLPVVRHLLQQAWEFILETEAQHKAEESE